VAAPPAPPSNAPSPPHHAPCAAQQPPHDFAAFGFGQGVGEADLHRLGEAADLVRHPLAQVYYQKDE
jgi:hypothetical protein